MVPRFMRRPQAELGLHVYGDSFVPGPEVGFRVLILSNEGFEVRVAEASLVCVESYWVTTSDGKTTRQQKRTRTIMEVPHQFLRGGSIRAGLAHREETTLTLPVDAPLSVNGKLANLEWQLRLSLDVPGARDLHAANPFSVATPEGYRTQGVPPPPAVAEKRFDDTRLRLEIPERACRRGESVEGVLRLDAIDECEFGEVRVELTRRERAGVKKGSTVADQAMLAPEARYRAASAKEWRFSLDIPGGAHPTTRVSDTTLTWDVKGILARRLRSDYAVKLEIDVI